jgi:hypothetical protein
MTAPAFDALCGSPCRANFAGLLDDQAYLPVVSLYLARK